MPGRKKRLIAAALVLLNAIHIDAMQRSERYNPAREGNRRWG
jgi:hypothetical protein